MRYCFCLIYISIFTQYAYGQWSASSREKIISASKAHFVKGPPGYISLWGGIKRKWKGGDPEGEVRDYYASKYFKNKTLPIYFSEQESKAPLSIYFPGIFGKYDGDLSPGIIDLLESKKSHVAVIPNFLSDTYIKSEPIYREDVSKTDITAASTIVKKIFLSIKKSHVTHINLIGESLGTFVASGVLSKLSHDERFKNLKINLILFSPPLKLHKVLENFDNEIHKSKQTYENCSFWYRYPSIFYHFIIQDIPKNVSKDFVKCLDSYLYHGVFKVGIKNSMKALKEVQGKKLVTAPKNFDQYFKEFNHNFYQMIQSKNEKLNLSFWLNKRKMSNTTVRIVSAQDDFLNTGIDWEKFLESSSLDKDNLIMLSWGAHSGFLALDIWPEVLYTEVIF